MKKLLLILFYFLHNMVASSPLNISVLSLTILVHASVLCEEWALLSYLTLFIFF